MPNYDYDDCDYDDLRAEEAAERRYQNALRYHPDCGDPDHPGCDNCEPENFED